MKRILVSVFLAVLMMIACAYAEEALFATIGEAMEQAEYDGIAGGDESRWVIVVTLDGRAIRVVAELDEESGALYDAIFEADIDDMEAAQAAYDEHLKTLPVLYTEEITAQPATRAELDALAGMTLSELEEAGYEENEIEGAEDDDVRSKVSCGLFCYELVLNEPYEVYLEHEENDTVGDLTVKSAEYAGISRNAADLRYHADGTVDPEEDAWGEFEALTGIVGDALAEAQESGEIDREALVRRVAEQLPDAEEDDIRMLVDLFIAVAEAGEDAAEDD